MSTKASSPPDRSYLAPPANRAGMIAIEASARGKSWPVASISPASKRRRFSGSDRMSLACEISLNLASAACHRSRDRDDVLGELAERLADVRRPRGGPGYAKDGIRISHNPSNVMSIQAVASPPPGRPRRRKQVLHAVDRELAGPAHQVAPRILELAQPRETTATTVPTSMRPVNSEPAAGAQAPPPRRRRTSVGYPRFLTNFSL